MTRLQYGPGSFHVRGLDRRAVLRDPVDVENKSQQTTDA